LDVYSEANSVAKKRASKSRKSETSTPKSLLQTKLDSLLRQQKYRQALDEIRKAQRLQPDLSIHPSEAEIWLLRGKQELESGQPKQASQSFRQALNLGLMGESHYWLAKSLVEMNHLDEAIALLRPGFEDGSLPKDYSICYPKLLLMKGEVKAVEALLEKQSKRFFAAQKYWLQGILALQAQQFDQALEFFNKVKSPTTPGDRPDIWKIYTHQALQHWDASALQLGLGLETNPMWGISLNTSRYNQHPVLQRLVLLHYMKTEHPPLEQLRFSLNDQFPELETLLNVLSLLEFIKEDEFHEAAHVLLNFDRRSVQEFPELKMIRPALLMLAGDQALNEMNIGCASEFWQLVHREESFNPQLAVNLMRVMSLNEDYQDLKRLLIQIIKWLEQEIRQHPEAWPEQRRQQTLAYAHCRLADVWMALGRESAALGELRKVEHIDPNSSELKGRQGLLAIIDGEEKQGIQLLTQALDEGCLSGEVYSVLVKTLNESGNPDAASDIRRRFGQKFGDLNLEREVTVPTWVDALSSGGYSLFSNIVLSSDEHEPAVRACQIFVDAVRSAPNSGGNVSIDQDSAVNNWEQLLETLSPDKQASTLQAIALSMILFSKREKGIAALINRYLIRLFELGSHQPEAREAHLVVLTVKERKPDKLQIPFRSYLNSVPQPGHSLAQVQLQVRRYLQDIRHLSTLRPLIDEFLNREPQNPLLLLAKATTYPVQAPEYDRFKQQGFEIARRLQDAKALKAFREEQAFLNAQEVQDLLPDPDDFENFGMDDIDELLENMIRKMLGDQVPPKELERMLPQLKQMMMDTMPDFDDSDPDFGDGFDFGFDSPFPFGAPPLGKKSKRRKRR
jgi:tetratricopeptide (TPR) repeat protein